LFACFAAFEFVIIMADKHTGETYCLSLTDKGKYDAKTRWLYTNRAFSRDCHCRIVNGDINAGTTAGKKTGKRSCLPV